jgi:hypothetical protein
MFEVGDVSREDENVILDAAVDDLVEHGGAAIAMAVEMKIRDDAKADHGVFAEAAGRSTFEQISNVRSSGLR